LVDDWHDDGGVINYFGPMAPQSAMASILENFVGDDGDFVLAHINCNHLVPHMQVVFEGSRVDVVGVNEIFLRDLVSSRAVAMKGYKFVWTVRGRTDTDGGGGG
jgi:hypothetical protein